MARFEWYPAEIGNNLYKEMKHESRSCITFLQRQMIQSRITTYIPQLANGENKMTSSSCVPLRREIEEKQICDGLRENKLPEVCSKRSAQAK